MLVDITYIHTCECAAAPAPAARAGSASRKGQQTVFFFWRPGLFVVSEKLTPIHDTAVILYPSCISCFGICIYVLTISVLLLLLYSSRGFVGVFTAVVCLSGGVLFCDTWTTTHARTPSVLIDCFCSAAVWRLPRDAACMISLRTSSGVSVGVGGQLQQLRGLFHTVNHVINVAFVRLQQ